MTFPLCHGIMSFALSATPTRTLSSILDGLPDRLPMDIPLYYTYICSICAVLQSHVIFLPNERKIPHRPSFILEDALRPARTERVHTELMHNEPCSPIDRLRSSSLLPTYLPTTAGLPTPLTPGTGHLGCCMGRAPTTNY